jgi:hypothetical protein
VRSLSSQAETERRRVEGSTRYRRRARNESAIASPHKVETKGSNLGVWSIFPSYCDAATGKERFRFGYHPVAKIYHDILTRGVGPSRSVHLIFGEVVIILLLLVEEKLTGAICRTAVLPLVSHVLRFTHPDEDAKRRNAVAEPCSPYAQNGCPVAENEKTKGDEGVRSSRSRPPALYLCNRRFPTSPTGRGPAHC